MKDLDLAFATISEAGSMLRSGDVTSVQLTELMLERIETHNETLNAFITVTADLALNQAQEADRELRRGHDRGPLQGIPMALKDLFATKGVRTTAGTKLYEDWVPDYDASVVTRLKEAGAVHLGKTGLNELAIGATSINPHYGAIANPWKLDHHPGGSSGGSAVAVAAGLAYAALGTDTGCSVRQPAQCCGIVGYKPSFGLVSTTGVVPVVWTLDHVGPLTRSVRDAGLVLQTIAGPDSTDRYSARRTPGDLLKKVHASIENSTLGVPRSYFFEGGDREVIQTVDQALETFDALGADLIEIDVPDLEAAFHAVIATFAETAAAHGSLLAERPEDFSNNLRKMLKTDAEKKATRYAEAQHFRRQFTHEIDSLMSEIDALVMPTSTVAAAPIAEQPADHAKERWKNTCIFNFTGRPSISVPCGFTKAGLPVGLMIAGRMFDDAKVLQVAHAYEQATPWHRKRPAL